jgi:hypothetical protein
MDAVASEPCAYHAMFPETQATDGKGGVIPALAEVETGHFVACFRLDEPGIC